MNIRKQLIRLGAANPHLRKHLKPVIASLTLTPAQVVDRGLKRQARASLMNVRVADVRDRVGPGINGQLVSGLVDLAFQSMHEDEYRDGYVGEVTFRTHNAFSEFAHKAEQALREYAMDPSNAEAVAWDRFYAKGHPFITKKDTEARDRALLRERGQFEDAMRGPGDVAAPELLTPEIPPVSEIVEMQPDAADFVEQALDDMDAFSYEIYMEMDGHGGDLDVLRPLFRDPSKVMTAVTRELRGPFQKIQDAMREDFAESVERERSERLEGQYYDKVYDPFERAFEYGGRAMKRLERDMPEMRGLMKSLDRVMKQAQKDFSVRQLERLLKMLGDFAEKAKPVFEEVQDRSAYRDVNDMLRDFEDVAYEGGRMLR